MSDFGRPHRSRKAIDYSSFVQEDGSDDDFEVPTPPLKKIRVDKKATNHKQTKTTKLKNEKKKSTEKRNDVAEKRERISLEKLEEQSFEREIQKVLELSKQESQKENDEIAAVVHNNNDESNLQPSKANLSPVVAAPHSLLTSIQPPQLNQNCVATHEPSIEILEEDVREGGKPSRRASASRKSLAENQEDDSDDDFHVGDVDNGSDGDFSDDGDDESDYEVSKPKTKMPKEPKKKIVANKEKNTTKKSKPTTGKAAKKTKASPPCKITSVSRVPTASLPNKSAAMIPTKTIGRGFTPPANRSGVSKTSTYCTPKEIVRKPIVMSPGGENPLGGVKLISPSQPRRLGLSRFARVKPLHS